MSGPVTWLDLTNALNGLRAELRADMTEVRKVALENMADIRGEMGELRERMDEGFDRLDRRIAWAAGIIGTLLLASIAIAGLILGQA